MGIYINLALFYLLLSFLQLEKKFGRKTRNRYVFLLLLIPFLLAALRGVDVGNDTHIYYRMYTIAGYYNKFLDYMANTRLEPGYALLEFLFQKNGASYEIFQIFTEIIIYLSINRFIRNYSNNYALSCFMFIVNRNLGGTMNTVRMWLAIAILLYSIPYIKERKLNRFLFVLFLAAMIHYSALIFVIVYFMAGVKEEKILYLLTIVITIAVTIIGTTFFRFLTSVIGKYEGYLSTGYFDTSGAIATYIGFFISLAFMVYYSILRRYPEGINRYEKNSDVVTDQYIFFLMCYFAFLLSIIGLRNQIMSRISSYFSVSGMALLPYALDVSPVKSNKRIMHLVICLLLFSEFIIIMVYRPNWLGIIPYKTFFAK